MTFSIKVKNSYEDKDWAFEKTLDNATHVQQVKSLCKKRFWGFSALLIPVRTNNLQNFAKDFFLPAVTQNALRIDSFILERLLLLVIDLGTLPIRVITVIPRAIYNLFHTKEKDPLYQYLKTQGLSENILKSDYVVVKFEWRENFTEQFGNTIHNIPKQIEHETMIAFVDLPTPINYYDLKTHRDI